jgi:hypothetical protein
MECTTSWGTTRIGDRHVFQHGAVGGATEEEFHEGSERVEEYLERYDSPVRRWDGPEPDTDSPEAEWGFEEALRDDVLRLAVSGATGSFGSSSTTLTCSAPSSPTSTGGGTHRRRIPANRLIVVSSFVINDPYWTLRTGSVPYWMVFNMQPSLEALNRYLDDRPPVRRHPPAAVPARGRGHRR